MVDGIRLNRRTARKLTTIKADPPSAYWTFEQGFLAGPVGRRSGMRRKASKFQSRERVLCSTIRVDQRAASTLPSLIYSGFNFSVDLQLVKRNQSG